MKHYININTLEYPVFENTIKQRVRGVSWSKNFTPPADYAEVFSSPKPIVDTLIYKINEGVPELKEDGKWYQTWSTRMLTQIERLEVKNFALESLRSRLITTASSKLDQFARSRGYDNINSACSWSSSAIEKFKSEGERCSKLRDDTWNKILEIINDLYLGNRPSTASIEDLLQELPNLSWHDPNS
jgi:hypothetical protein